MLKKLKQILDIVVVFFSTPVFKNSIIFQFSHWKACRKLNKQMEKNGRNK